jgi:hypothetical protein
VNLAYTVTSITHEWIGDATEHWEVTADLPLAGDTYQIAWTYEVGEYGERAFAVTLDGVDQYWDDNGEERDTYIARTIPHDWIEEWIYEVLSPVWERVQQARDDAMSDARHTYPVEV